MSCFRARSSRWARAWGALLLGALGVGLLSGCIADSAEDSDLPWSSSRNWEGLGPLPSIMTDRYD